MNDINDYELYEIIERSIDLAMMENKFVFKMYPYLQSNQCTRRQTNVFI